MIVNNTGHNTSSCWSKYFVRSPKREDNILKVELLSLKGINLSRGATSVQVSISAGSSSLFNPSLDSKQTQLLTWLVTNEKLDEENEGFRCEWQSGNQENGELSIPFAKSDYIFFKVTELDQRHKAVSDYSSYAKVAIKDELEKLPEAGQEHVFNGKMGIECDDTGVVKRVEVGGRAEDERIQPGFKIWKFTLAGTVEQTYSRDTRDALHDAENSTSDYKVKFLVWKEHETPPDALNAMPILVGDENFKKTKYGKQKWNGEGWEAESDEKKQKLTLYKADMFSLNFKGYTEWGTLEFNYRLESRFNSRVDSFVNVFSLIPVFYPWLLFVIAMLEELVLPGITNDCIPNDSRFVHRCEGFPKCEGSVVGLSVSDFIAEAPATGGMAATFTWSLFKLKTINTRIRKGSNTFLAFCVFFLVFLMSPVTKYPTFHAIVTLLFCVSAILYYNKLLELTQDEYHVLKPKGKKLLTRLVNIAIGALSSVFIIQLSGLLFSVIWHVTPIKDSLLTCWIFYVCECVGLSSMTFFPWRWDYEMGMATARLPTSNDQYV